MFLDLAKYCQTFVAKQISDPPQRMERVVISSVLIFDVLAVAKLHPKAISNKNIQKYINSYKKGCSYLTL